MKTAVQFIVNEKGQKTSAIVPFNDWENLNNNYNILLQKLNLKKKIKEGLYEVIDAKRSGKKLQMLNNLIDEFEN